MPGWAELGWSVFAMRHSKSMPGACICPGSALSLLIREKKVCRRVPAQYSALPQDCWDGLQKGKMALFKGQEIPK